MHARRDEAREVGEQKAVEVGEVRERFQTRVDALPRQFGAAALVERADALDVRERAAVLAEQQRQERQSSSFCAFLGWVAKQQQ